VSLAAGCGAGAEPPPGPAPPPAGQRFDAERAFALLRRQVALGPRPAGSPASRRLAGILRRELPRGRFEPVPGGLRNVVGHLPARGAGRDAPAVLVGAHYDTKDIPGFVGANDGAGGTATVVELARALERLPAPADRPEIRFVLFDGEESPAAASDADFLREGVRGSRAYLSAHPGEIGAVIVVDFVADRDLSLPREGGSDPRLWSRLRAAARRAGVLSAFPRETRPEVLDDHTPFARAGIPAIDLIDFEYPYFHTSEDTLARVSARSLDRAGEALVELLLTV
jgi:glutaminyl-peptide cyclotransferase